MDFDSLKRAFVITELEHWNDIFRLDQRFLSQFVFRGQGNAEWRLSTALSRLIQKHNPGASDSMLPLDYEAKMINEFRWKYPSYEKGRIPDEQDSIEWLSLMQHYGARTRMLDFSYSVYVALFMALDESYCDKSAVWAVNKSVLERAIVEKYKKEKGQESVSQSALEEFIYKEATNAINRGYNKDSEALLFVTRPHMSNERINRQQGLFIIPSIVSREFDEILKSYYDATLSLEWSIDSVVEASKTWGQDSVAVMKILVPLKLKYSILDALDHMNITPETLYPGLDGLARSMSKRRASSSTTSF